jgi:hypothetical protein
MDEGIFDPAFNDLLATKTLFMSAGWIKYEEHVKELVVNEQDHIDRLLNDDKPLSDNDMKMLNMHKTLLRAWRALLLIKEEMLDSVDPEREEKIEHTGFDTSEMKSVKDETDIRGRFVQHIDITPKFEKLELAEGAALKTDPKE